MSREQAAENRRAIVAAATQLFRERGVDAVGLNELMKHAGFTQGGFYNHFESKAALVAEVLASAMAEKNAELVKNARAPVDESTTALRRHPGIYRERTATTSMTAAPSPFAGDAPPGRRRRITPSFDDQITILAGLIAESDSSCSGTLGRCAVRQSAIANWWARWSCHGPWRRPRRSFRTRF